MPELLSRPSGTRMPANSSSKGWILTISKRLGHAKPSVTLAVYAHMFTSDNRKAAAAINAALKP